MKLRCENSGNNFGLLSFLTHFSDQRSNNTLKLDFKKSYHFIISASLAETWMKEDRAPCLDIKEQQTARLE